MSPIRSAFVASARRVHSPLGATVFGSGEELVRMWTRLIEIRTKLTRETEELQALLRRTAQIEYDPYAPPRTYRYVSPDENPHEAVDRMNRFIQLEAHTPGFLPHDAFEANSRLRQIRNDRTIIRRWANEIRGFLRAEKKPISPRVISVGRMEYSPRSASRYVTASVQGPDGDVNKITVRISDHALDLRVHTDPSDAWIAVGIGPEDLSGQRTTQRPARYVRTWAEALSLVREVAIEEAMRQFYRPPPKYPLHVRPVPPEV